MTEIERYKAALAIAVSRLKLAEGFIAGSAREPITEDIYAINALINPPVEMEDVPIERWAIFNSLGIALAYYDSKEAGAREWPEHALVKLTGTLTRPKPVPVEKSVSVDGAICTAGHLTMTDKALYEFPEARGKRGILTFTWAE